MSEQEKHEQEPVVAPGIDQGASARKAAWVAAWEERIREIVREELEAHDKRQCAPSDGAHQCIMR